MAPLAASSSRAALRCGASPARPSRRAWLIERTGRTICATSALSCNAGTRSREAARQIHRTPHAPLSRDPEAAMARTEDLRPGIDGECLVLLFDVQRFVRHQPDLFALQHAVHPGFDRNRPL